jgi:hypothetical protein
VVVNVINVMKMIDSSDWKQIKKGIEQKQVDKFEEVFSNKPAQEAMREKMNLVGEILGPLAQVTHHLETCGARASWVFPVCVAVLIALKEWAEKPAVARHFQIETREAVVNKFLNRWEGGQGTQVRWMCVGCVMFFFGGGVAGPFVRVLKCVGAGGLEEGGAHLGLLA